MNRSTRVLCWLTLSSIALPGQIITATEIDSIDVTVNRGVYRIDMTFELVLSVPETVALLTNFDYPDPLNPEVTGRQVISISGDITRVRTEFQTCSLFVCKPTVLVQDVSSTEGYVVAKVVPDGSSFKSGTLEWHIVRSDNGGSVVKLGGTMEPGFFVLPFIGTLIAKNRLKKQLAETAMRLEHATSDVTQ